MERSRFDPRRLDWVALRRTPSKLVAILLAAALLFTGIAWQVQAAAARALERAREIGLRETEDAGGPPPSLAENREVLAVLDDSIRIRREIDDLLGLVEGSLSELRRTQSRSEATAATGRRELRAIAVSLGGSVGATRASIERLRGLDARLDASVTLARLIAEELEELDRKLGPTVGAGR